MTLTPICSKVSGHFDAFRVSTNNNLQYGTFSRLLVDFILSKLQVHLNNEPAPASFRIAISTPFPTYDRRGDEQLEVPVFLLVS